MYTLQRNKGMVGAHCAAAYVHAQTTRAESLGALCHPKITSPLAHTAFSTLYFLEELHSHGDQENGLLVTFRSTEERTPDKQRA